MKKSILFIITLFLIFTSCKKEAEQTGDNSIVKFYANNPNTDGLLAEVKISDKNATAFFYGTSNDSNEPRDINSISFVPNNTDTITNLILDNNKRPSIVTFNKKNGQKINTIVKYKYLTNDTISYSVYSYDWISHKDSLLFQAKTKDTYSIKTYGARGFTIDANFRSTAITLVSSLAVAAVVCGTIAVLGPPALVWALANPGWALGGLTFAAGIIANASPNQQIQTTINPNAPTSPTNGFIPNPTGTPQDPVGLGYPIKLTEISITKYAQYNGNGICAGYPAYIYYLKFSANDPDTKIRSDLSNLKFDITWLGGNCGSAWSTAYANTFFANYPSTISNSIINTPYYSSLGNTGTWVEIRAYFADLATGFRISNYSTFRVTQGVNYP